MCNWSLVLFFPRSTIKEFEAGLLAYASRRLVIVMYWFFLVVHTPPFSTFHNDISHSCPYPRSHFVHDDLFDPLIHQFSSRSSKYEPAFRIVPIFHSVLPLDGIFSVVILLSEVFVSDVMVIDVMFKHCSSSFISDCHQMTSNYFCLLLG